MNKQDLEELAEQDKKVADSIALRMSKAPENRVSVLDFYPEFENLRDRLYASNIPYLVDTAQKKLEHVPTYVMLPFYETLVVGIEPLKDEMTFRRWYGMDVAQIMEMTKSERMRVRLTSPTLLYDGLDYLDPLLETNPPTFIRGEAFGHLVGGEAHLNEADLEFARFKAEHEAKEIDSRLGDLRSH